MRLILPYLTYGQIRHAIIALSFLAETRMQFVAVQECDTLVVTFT